MRGRCVSTATVPYHRSHIDLEHQRTSVADGPVCRHQTSGLGPDNPRARDQAYGRTMHTARSLTFVPVDPVMTASSRLFSNADVS